MTPTGIWPKVREFWARMTGWAMPVDPKLMWPPLDQRERLNWYRAGYLLFKGRHQEVFEPFWPAGRRYLTNNVLGAITRLCARRLFGEPADLEATREEGDVEAAQELLKLLSRQSRLDLLNLRQAQTVSYCGDCVYKVRYDAGRDRVVIEGVNPAFFFPTFADGDQLEIARAEIAWATPRPEKGLGWLRKEIHEPGLVRYELWELRQRPGAPAEDWYLGDQVPLGRLEAWQGMPDQVETGIEELLVVHIPNMQVAEDGLWGVSDYGTVLSLQSELNNRASRLAATLDLHANPRLYGPLQFVGPDGKFHAEEHEYIIVQEGEKPPAYLEPTGAALQFVKQELDDLRLDILRNAGISPESMGLGEGGTAESGRAIKLRQTDTTSTVQAKGALFDEGLRRVLSVATKLWAVQVQDRGDVGDVDPLEADDIAIKRSDGLPEDPMDDATLFQTLTQPAALKPEVAASMAFGWSEEEALEKVKEPPAPTPPPQAGLPFTPLAQRAAALQERRASLAAPAEVTAGGATRD